MPVLFVYWFRTYCFDFRRWHRDDGLLDHLRVADARQHVGDGVIMLILQVTCIESFTSSP